MLTIDQVRAALRSRMGDYFVTGLGESIIRAVTEHQGKKYYDTPFFASSYFRLGRVGKNTFTITSNYGKDKLRLPLSLIAEIIGDNYDENLKPTQTFVREVSSGERVAQVLSGLIIPAGPFYMMGGGWDVPPRQRSPDPFRFILVPFGDGFELDVRPYDKEEIAARKSAEDAYDKLSKYRFDGHPAIVALAETLIPVIEKKVAKREERRMAQVRKEAAQAEAKLLEAKSKQVGKFKTRAELLARVWDQFLGTLETRTDIAKSCGIPTSALNGIVRDREGYPDQATRAKLALARAAQV